MSGDLAAEALAPLLGGRPLRTYRAVLSTEAVALAWAREGAPGGAVVVADYQASPRGRGGWPWAVTSGSGLGFSIVLRPALPEEREGWLYTAATVALAGIHGGDARIEWPADVHVGGRWAGGVGVQTEAAGGALAWAVLTVLLAQAEPPRGALLAAAVAALEERLGAPEDEVLAEHRERCRTIGRTVRLRLVPMGPAGAQVAGEAATTLSDGALVVVTAEGRRVAVTPQALGLLEDLPGEA